MSVRKNEYMNFRKRWLVKPGSSFVNWIWGIKIRQIILLQMSWPVNTNNRITFEDFFQTFVLINFQQKDVFSCLWSNILLELSVFIYEGVLSCRDLF